MEWEVRIIEWMQSNANDLSRFFGELFSFIGGEMGLMVMLVISMFCWKKKTGQRLVMVVASLLSWFAMIKAVVKRPRPYFEYPDRVKTLTPVSADASATDIAAQAYSFPSMHSGAVVTSYFTLAREIKKKWSYLFASVLSLLVGYFRVVTGNHYPSDVIAGWILGFVIIWIFDLLDKHIKKQWVQSLMIIAVTLPGLIYVRTEDYFTSLGLMIGASLAIPFERKYVKYEDTRNVFAMILRSLGAFAIYIGFNTLLKMPFDKQFLVNASLAALTVRTIRYTIIIFVILGIYPKVFPLFEKIGRKR